MNSPAIHAFFAASAIVAAACSANADRIWNADTSGTTKYWSDLENWTGDSGNWIVRYDEMNGSPVTINLGETSTLANGVWLCNHHDGVITLKGENDAAGLYMNDGAGDFHVGNATPGAAVIDGGTYRFANDLLVGADANGDGILTVKSGTISTRYWLNIATGSNAKGVMTNENGNVTMSSGRMNVAQAANSQGTYVQTGGATTVSGELRITDGAGSVGKYIQKGGVTKVTSYLCVGSTSKGSYDALFQLDGGAVTNSGNYLTIASWGDSTSVAKLQVNGGELYVANDIWVGERVGSAEMEVTGGTVKVPNGKIKISQSSNDSRTDTETYVLNMSGGTIETKAIEFGAGIGAGSFNWSGGTVKPVAATTDFLPSNEKLTVAISGTGATLDTDYNVTIASALSGSGTLTKSGSGALTLTGDFASGTLDVQEGVLILPEGATVNTLKLGANARLYIKGSNAAAAADTDALKELVKVTNWDVNESATINGYTGARQTASGTATTTTWIGGAGLFTDAANWTDGVPESQDTVRFVADAEPQKTGTNTGNTFAGIVVENNAYVKFHNLTDGNYPQFNVSSVSGMGTLEFRNRCGLGADAALTIPDTITLVFANDNGSTTGTDSWLQGNDFGIVVEGSVTVENYLCLYKGITFNNKVTFEGGSRLHCDNNAAITLGAGFEAFVADGDTATVDGKWNNDTQVFTKTGAGTLKVNHTGYGELVMVEGVAELASNEGPTSYFTFKGGSLKLNYAMTWWDALIGRINNSPNHTSAIKIDTGDGDWTLSTAIGGTHTTYGFVKQGAGTLALGANPAWTGGTTIEEGTLVLLDVGYTLPGELSIADGAAVSVTLDPTVWVVEYSGTLFSYGSLAGGTSLVLGATVLRSGLSAQLGLDLDTTESGVVKATVTGESLVWNGGSGDWWGEGAWKGKSSGEAMTFENDYTVAFNGGDIMTETGTNTVNVSAAADVALFNSTAGEGKAYCLTGEGLSAASLYQSGAGSLILANDSLTVSGAANITAGELVLEGATLTAGSIANDATIRASGETVSALATEPSGSGAIVIETNATLNLSAPMTISQNVTGDGTLNLSGSGTYTLPYQSRFANFAGSVRVPTGATLNIDLLDSDQVRNAFGENATLVMAGGTIGKFSVKDHMLGSTIKGKLVAEAGTTSTLRNYENRQDWAGGIVNLECDISGSGTLSIGSTSGHERRVTFSGDNDGFTGVMNLDGRIYAFANANAGSSNAVWNLTSANTFYLDYAAGSTIAFGALNVTQSGAKVNIYRENAFVEVGNKADSTIEGSFTGSEFTLNKVGASTTLTLNGDATNANVVVKAGYVGGTGTVKALAVEDGAAVDCGELADTTQTYTVLKSLTDPVIANRYAVKNGSRSNGRWKLVTTTETVDPDSEVGGDEYTVYNLCATFCRSGLIIIFK